MLASLAQVLQYLNDVRRTTRVYEWLKPYAKFIQIAGNSAICGAPVSDALGVAATTLGRWDEARTYFDDAIAQETRMGARPRIAWTLCSHAQMLQTRAHAGRQGASCHTPPRGSKAIGAELGMRRIGAWAESHLDA